MTTSATAGLSRIAYTAAVTCPPDTTVTDAAGIMRDSGAGSVVVVDSHARLQGIVTDRDLAIRALADGRDPTLPVEDVMTRDVVYVYDSEDVATASMRMVEHQCRRLPVLDGEGTVVGVVTLDDLLQTFGQQIEMLATVVGHASAWERVPETTT